MLAESERIEGLSAGSDVEREGLGATRVSDWIQTVCLPIQVSQVSCPCEADLVSSLGVAARTGGHSGIQDF